MLDRLRAQREEAVERRRGLAPDRLERADVVRDADAGDRLAPGALTGLEPGELPQRRLVEVALEAAAATAPALDAPRHDDDRRHGGSAEPDDSFVVPARTARTGERIRS